MSRVKLDELWLEDSDDKLYRRVSGGFREVSPSVAGGEGAVNYAKNPLEEDSLSQLTYSGVTPAWSTTHNLFGGGALRCNMTSSGTGRYLRIALDDLSDAQITEMLRLSFFYKLVTGGDDAVRLSIWDGTNHTYLAPEYLIAASGSITKYDGWCFSISKTSHYLQFTFKDSTAIDFYIAAVSFVPRVLPQGAVISEWQSYTPTFQGMGTVTEIDFRWRRVGSNIEIVGYCKNGTVTSTEAQVSLPPGIVTRSTIVAAGLPCGHAFRPNASTTYYYTSVICEPSKTYFGFGAQVSSAGALDGPLVGTSLFTSGAYLSLQCSIPVEGWISSINLVTEAQEFASNSSSTDADDTTSFVYGPQGASGVIATTTLTARRIKRVRFKNKIQPTDSFAIEFYLPSTGGWVNGNIFISGYGIANNYCYITGEGGMQYSPVAGSDTDLDIVFQRYPIGSTSYGWGYSGFAGVKWRVRKISNGNMAEAPASGIYESGSNANGYYVKYVDGTLMQWVTNLASDAIALTKTFNITWPVPFADTNYTMTHSYYENSSGTGSYNTASGAKTTTGMTYAMYVSSGTSVIAYADFFAIGKWNLSRSVAAPGTPVGASTVFASATGASVSVTSGAPIQFNTIEEDSLSCITTGASWKFTAPVSGLYLVNAWYIDGDTFDAGRAYLFKNGVTTGKSMFYRDQYETSRDSTHIIRLAQGDYIDIRPSASDSACDSAGIQITRLSA